MFHDVAEVILCGRHSTFEDPHRQFTWQAQPFARSVVMFRVFLRIALASAARSGDNGQFRGM
jgi:hypothetical protein